jgi:hypothetical protein
MHRYNTKAKIPLNKEQTPKQGRARMKNGSHHGEVTNRRGREKKEVKKVDMGDVLSIQD